MFIRGSCIEYYTVGNLVAPDVENIMSHEFSHITRLIDIKLKRYNSSHYYNDLGGALVRAASKETPEQAAQEFASLKERLEKHPAALSKAKSNGTIIYLLSNKTISVKHNELPAEILEILSEYNNLANEAKVVLGKNGYQENIRFLFDCLASSIKSKSPTLLDPYRNLINCARTARSDLHKGVSITCSTLIALLVIYAFSTESQYGILPKIHQSAPYTLGVIGAWLSFIQRPSTNNSYAPTYQMYSNAIFRVTAGALFGYVASLIMASGLAFNAFSHNDSMYKLILFVAGFSERIVPDIIGRVEKTEKPREP